jgi:hypothetical protein
MLRVLRATRYVTALREGGSLPAIVEANDDGMYVAKFRGAGQGLKALIAELIGSEIGRAGGLKVPEVVFMEIDPALGRNEPDFEIQALLKASPGLNLALDYLPGSLAYDALVNFPLEASVASQIVWFDAFITNVDRTARNTNMLIWHKKLWLIDHAAAFFFHFTWGDYLKRSLDRFPSIKDHVLLPFAGELAEADKLMKTKLNRAKFTEILGFVPEDWFETEGLFESVAAHRAAYVDYLTNRLENSHIFLEEAQNARNSLL